MVLIYWNTKNNLWEFVVFLRIKNCGFFGVVVRKKGLEPSRLAVQTPEACASTNFATFAWLKKKWIVVIPMRVELMTTGFGNRYSIHLSYGIMNNHLWSAQYYIKIIQPFKKIASYSSSYASKCRSFSPYPRTKVIIVL